MGLRDDARKKLAMTKTLVNDQFWNQDLRGEDFTNCALTGVGFNGSDLSGANFTSSQIANCFFSNCNLSGVIAVSTQWHDNYFENAIFKDIDFRGAQINQAAINGAIFELSLIHI